ncbi:hypothetical protein PF010_g16614 [Phytophthora fragariae]|nr:hypothetical protein PF009_g18067 [Phytophthora fragariae]KAE8994574.1 hypothetical protein PF011_g16684 [Phytophthora fragariae]KAE9095698.1 hypothetical protein PF010_g16614 [Phytophthora fragariae]KAE9096355.1 hypothetical protein PF007_g17036 [Phytophthora fragariae]KAE9128973.1 hypothetical protein PF006_g16143 [Phytophthora fragariae]
MHHTQPVSQSGPGARGQTDGAGLTTTAKTGTRGSDAAAAKQHSYRAESCLAEAGRTGYCAVLPSPRTRVAN